MASHWFNWRFNWRSVFVHYTKSGLGDPILLLHDLYAGASLEEFERNVNFLSSHFTVYRLDLVGFGLSDGNALRYRAQAYIDLISDFLHQVVGVPAHVVAVGHSGAFVAAAAAKNPALFGGLVLISPCASPVATGRWRWAKRVLREAFWLALVTPPFRSVFREVMAGHWELGEFLRRTIFDWRCIDPSKLDRSEELAREPHALAACASLEAGFLSAPLHDVLPRGMNSMMFIYGSECDGDYIQYIDRFTKMVDGCRVERVQKAKFWPHYEMVGYTNKAITDFLREQCVPRHEPTEFHHQNASELCV